MKINRYVEAEGQREALLQLRSQTPDPSATALELCPHRPGTEAPGIHTVGLRGPKGPQHLQALSSSVSNLKKQRGGDGAESRGQRRVRAQRVREHADKGKKVAPAPAVVKKQEAKKVVNPLFEKRPKNFGIGQDIQPKRDLTRFVKRPRCIRLQRQRAILYKRLKVPPAINQFTQALDRQTATQLLKLAHKYRPETKQEKKQGLLAQAEKKAAGKGDVPTKRPPVLRAGVNTVTTLVENKWPPIPNDTAWTVEKPLGRALLNPAEARKPCFSYCRPRHQGLCYETHRSKPLRTSHLIWLPIGLGFFSSRCHQVTGGNQL
ncbi:60S ribosomal protein L7a [Fukomys damarensis]|uniref:60S ribosomal protein L7a n=1 Tax=Fukomys damarensis TaxID=885580 RepID=A0A091CXZ6_FUKDA|nr:60S ribosomal protein L7a [Fukomys damarensis]